MCVCVCIGMYIHVYIYIYIYTYKRLICLLVTSHPCLVSTCYVYCATATFN